MMLKSSHGGEYCLAVADEYTGGIDSMLLLLFLPSISSSGRREANQPVEYRNITRGKEKVIFSTALLSLVVSADKNVSLLIAAPAQPGLARPRDLRLRLELFFFFLRAFSRFFSSLSLFMASACEALHLYRQPVSSQILSKA